MTTDRFMAVWEYEYRYEDTPADALQKYRDDMERLLYEAGIDDSPDSDDLNGRYDLSDLRDDHPDEVLLSVIGTEFANGHYESQEGRLMVLRDRLEEQLDTIDDVLEAEQENGVVARAHDAYKDVLDNHTDWYERGHEQVEEADDHRELFREAHTRQRIELLINPINGLFLMAAGGLVGMAGVAGADPGLTVGGFLTAETGYTMAAAQENLEDGRRNRYQEETAEMMLDRIEDDLDNPSIEIREY